MHNIIPDFTKQEIDYIIANANFTKDEKTLFLLRNNEHPFEECAEIMNVSNTTVYRIIKRVYKKISKVIEEKY